MDNIRQGVCTSWDKQYGTGVIETANGASFPVSYKQILMDGYKYLSVGDRVSFQIGIRGDGLQAINVFLIWQGNYTEKGNQNGKP